MIKLFLADVDGTLTNGIYTMTEDGALSKGFFSRDFHGMWMLSETGVKVGIISYSRDKVILTQCDRCAKYADVMVGAKDKVETIQEKYIDTGFCCWQDVAYIADDVVDIELLQMVGLPACPEDADPAVLDLIWKRDDGFKSGRAAGRGAVREFADYIREVNGRS